MKKILIILVSIFIFSNESNSQSNSIELNPETTIIQWIGRKVVGEHNGKIKIQKGQINVNGDAIVGGMFIVDMNSMTCDDIKNEESNSGLIGHLKNNDFFAVEKFPTASLEIIGQDENSKKQLKGNLTIKGKTHPVVFSYKVVDDANTKTYESIIKFDRTKYDIVYNSSLVDVAKDRMIDDIVELIIKFQVK